MLNVGSTVLSEDPGPWTLKSCWGEKATWAPEFVSLLPDCRCHVTSHPTLHLHILPAEMDCMTSNQKQNNNNNNTWLCGSLHLRLGLAPPPKVPLIPKMLRHTGLQGIWEPKSSKSLNTGEWRNKEAGQFRASWRVRILAKFLCSLKCMWMLIGSEPVY